ncbi:MAG: hypothetical protein QOE70_3872 [Chthoniobacter sp.]|jgi:hypothetical protein|nr:hypothetical protein [Chthoniobacter sp.]
MIWIAPLGKKAPISARGARQAFAHGWSRNVLSLQIQSQAHERQGKATNNFTQNRIVAEYALRGIKKVIGVSEYQLTCALPKKLQSALPSIGQIEAELSTPATTRTARKAAGAKRA